MGPARQKKRTTIRDVARVAEVDEGTVSRVVHDDPRISDATKTKVRKIIEKLKYEPNLVARGLARNKTQTIALITPELHPYVQPLVKGVLEACLQHNYATMVFAEGTWVKEGETLARIAQNWRVDGILFYHLISTPDQKVSAPMRDLMGRMPVVFFNKFLKEESINAVGVDGEKGIQLAVEHLASMGHKKIGMLTGGAESVHVMERTQGFMSALDKCGLGLDPRWIQCANFRETEGFEMTVQLLSEADAPTAIVCQNDQMAFGALEAAKWLGKRVPEDIAITGFDNEEAAPRVSPSLTSVDLPMEEVGVQGVKLMMELIAKPGQDARRIVLPPRLVVRRSSDASAPERSIRDRA